MSCEERLYLRCTGVGKVIDRILAEVVRERPAQPYHYMARRVEEIGKEMDARREASARLQNGFTPKQYARTHRKVRRQTANQEPPPDTSTRWKSSRTQPTTQDDDLGALEGFGDAIDLAPPSPSPPSEEPDTDPQPEPEPTPEEAFEPEDGASAFAVCGSVAEEEVETSREEEVVETAVSPREPPPSSPPSSPPPPTDPVVVATCSTVRRITITQLYKFKVEGLRQGRRLVKQYDAAPTRIAKAKGVKFNTRGFHSRQEQGEIGAWLGGVGSVWTYHDLVTVAFRDPATAKLLSETFLVKKIAQPLALRSVGSTVDLCTLLDEILYYDLLKQETLYRANAAGFTLYGETLAKQESPLSSAFLQRLSEKAASWMAMQKGFPREVHTTERTPHIEDNVLFAKEGITDANESSEPSSECDAGLYTHSIGKQYVISLRIFFEVAEVVEQEYLTGARRFVSDAAKEFKRRAANSEVLSTVELWHYPLVCVFVSCRFGSQLPGEEWTKWLLADRPEGGTVREALTLHTNLFCILWTHLWRLAALHPVTPSLASPLISFFDKEVMKVVHDIVALQELASQGDDSGLCSPLPPHPLLRLDWVRQRLKKEPLPEGSSGVAQRLAWNAETALHTSLLRRFAVSYSVVAKGMPWEVEGAAVDVMQECRRFWENSFGEGRVVVRTDVFQDAFVKHINESGGTSLAGMIRSMHKGSYLAERGGAFTAANDPHALTCVVSMLLSFLDYFQNGTSLVSQFVLFFACIAPQGETTSYLARALVELANVYVLNILIPSALDSYSASLSAITMHQVATLPERAAFSLRGGPRAFGMVARRRGAWHIEHFPEQTSLSAALSLYLGTQQRGGEKYFRTLHELTRHMTATVQPYLKQDTEMVVVATDLLLCYRPMAEVEVVKALCRRLHQVGGYSGERLALVLAPLLVYSASVDVLLESRVVSALKETWLSADAACWAAGRAVALSLLPAETLTQATSGMQLEEYLFRNAALLARSVSDMGGPGAYVSALSSAHEAVEEPPQTAPQQAPQAAANILKKKPGKKEKGRRAV